MDPEIDTQSSHIAGFSLIELVVVMAVIAILSLSVSLSLSRGKSVGGMPRDAVRMQGQFAALRDSAIHGRRPAALSVIPAGWQVMRMQDGVWQGAGPRVRWSGAAVFQRDLSAPLPDGSAPEVVFLPDGRSTAFSIRFTDRGVVAVCTSDGWAPLECNL